MHIYPPLLVVLGLLFGYVGGSGVTAAIWGPWGTPWQRTAAYFGGLALIMVAGCVGVWMLG